MHPSDYLDDSHRLLRTTVKRFVDEAIKSFVNEWEKPSPFHANAISKPQSEAF